MSPEKEAQARDFVNNVAYTISHYPHFTREEVLTHAWLMLKRIYFRLTSRDRQNFTKLAVLPDRMA